MSTKEKADELRRDLAHYYGGDTVYRHIFGLVIYTSGVKHFADAAGAYWFLDILATERAILKEADEFAVVTLTVADSRASIVVTDGGKDGNDPKTVFSRDISYTDCPPGEWKFFFEQRVIMLPQER